VYSNVFNGAFNDYGGTVSGNTDKSGSDLCIISGQNPNIFESPPFYSRR
jgi:hypothetical protein